VRVAALSDAADDDGRLLDGRDPGLLLLAFVFPLLVVVAYLATRSALSYSSALEIAAGQGGPSTLRVQVLDNSSLQQLSGQPSSYLNPQSLTSYSVFGLPAISSMEILVAVAGAVAVLMIWRGLRVHVGHTAPFEDDGLFVGGRRAAAAEVLDAAARKLSSGSSYRETVIRCYKEFSEVLENASDLEGRVLTAREFEAQVVEKLRVEPAYLARMTRLFEVARYSEQEITLEQSRDAVVCLTEMSSSLRQPVLQIRGVG
jgi:hypothetical protein